MSIISDIAIAVKTIHVEKFMQVCKDNGYDMEHDANMFKRHARGVLCILNEIETYSINIANILEYLKENIPIKDFLIIEACSTYPGSEDEDAGKWNNNPWKIRKVISVSIGFNGSNELKYLQACCPRTIT